MDQQEAKHFGKSVGLTPISSLGAGFMPGQSLKMPAAWTRYDALMIDGGLLSESNLVEG